jgi:hypothetical protein
LLYFLYCTCLEHNRMPKRGGKEEEKVAEEEGGEAEQEIVYDVDHVDYGKSCSRIFSPLYIKQILEYCRPRQKVRLGMVSKRWLGMVDAMPNKHQSALEATFDTDFLPKLPGSLTPKETVAHLFEGAAEMSAGEEKARAVCLSLTDRQIKTVRAWKEGVLNSVENIVPKAFLPWSTVDEAAAPEATKLTFRYYGQYCLVVVSNEVASRIGCSNCQMKFWKDDLAGNDEIEDAVSSDDEADDMDFVEYFVEGEEYDKFNIWRRKHASGRLFPDSVFPAGPYSGIVRFSITRNKAGELGMDYATVKY